MSYDDNVRDNPEKYDLTIVVEMDSGGSYDFDIHIVWKHKDGTLYYAHDAGCSCPHPFEDFEDLESLEKIEKDHFGSFQDRINLLDAFDMTERAQFLRKVKEAF